MKLPVSILTAALLAASSALYAQAGSDNAGASKGGRSGSGAGAFRCT